MMQIEKTKQELERGFICQACGTPVPGTSLYATRCPKCGQLYQVSTAKQEQPKAGHQA